MQPNNLQLKVLEAQSPGQGRHRACAMSRSLYAIKSPFVRDPAPFVTRWRSRTVANGDSITFEVLRCFHAYEGGAVV